MRVALSGIRITIVLLLVSSSFAVLPRPQSVSSSTQSVHILQAELSLSLSDPSLEPAGDLFLESLQTLPSLPKHMSMGTCQHAYSLRLEIIPATENEDSLSYV